MRTRVPGSFPLDAISRSNVIPLKASTAGRFEGLEGENNMELIVMAFAASLVASLVAGGLVLLSGFSSE